MKVECPNCKKQFQVVDVDGVMSERKMISDMIEAYRDLDAVKADRAKLFRIWSMLDEIMLTMRPRHCGHPSMDGNHPCWIVWLPKEGSTTRKSLADALIAFVDQSDESLSGHPSGDAEKQPGASASRTDTPVNER